MHVSFMSAELEYCYRFVSVLCKQTTQRVYSLAHSDPHWIQQNKVTCARDSFLCYSSNRSIEYFTKFIILGLFWTGIGPTSLKYYFWVDILKSRNITMNMNIAWGLGLSRYCSLKKIYFTFWKNHISNMCDIDILSMHHQGK